MSVPTDIVPTTIVPTTGKQVTKKALSPADTFRDLLERLKPQIMMAIPKHLDIDRMVRICMTTVQRNPDLLACTQESLLGCIFQCVQLGLEPDGLLGHAYLIPFRDNKNNRTICTLVVGYKGMLKLARQSNEIKSVSARVVYSNDFFEYEFGLEDKLVHKPTHGDAGELTYAYCIFRYKDGGYHFDVMSKGEIEAIRLRSKNGQSANSPWATDYDEMAKKTVIRRTSKMAPASTEDLHRAATLDSRSEAGFAPALDFQVPGGDQSAAELPGSAPGEQGRRLSLARPAATQSEPPADEFVVSTSKQRREISDGAALAHIGLEDVCKWFKVGNIAELSRAQADEALARILTVTGNAKEPDEPGSNG